MNKPIENFLKCYGCPYNCKKCYPVIGETICKLN